MSPDIGEGRYVQRLQNRKTNSGHEVLRHLYKTGLNMYFIAVPDQDLPQFLMQSVGSSRAAIAQSHPRQGKPAAYAQQQTPTESCPNLTDDHVYAPKHKDAAQT
jgi:hypothetical protein